MSSVLAASAGTSDSEDSATDSQQNGVKKRKRPMTISCVVSSFSDGSKIGAARPTMSNELINCHGQL